MTEVPAPYTAGDPGDEAHPMTHGSGPRLRALVQAQFERQERLAAAIEARETRAAQAILPQYDDLAVCVQRAAALIRHGAIWRDADWLEKQAVRRLVLDLDARLGQREPFAEREVNGELR